MVPHTASGSRAGSVVGDLSTTSHLRRVVTSRPGNLLDVSAQQAVAVGGGGGDTAGRNANVPFPTSRSVRKKSSGGSGILSEFALSTLGGGGGGETAGGEGRAQQQLQQQLQQQQQHYAHTPQPLSPAIRGGAPPGSVLSSFASPGSNSFRCG